MLFALLVSCSILIASCHSSPEPKLQGENLLLPLDRWYSSDSPSPLPVSHEISGSPGCFEWTSCDPTVIGISTQEEDGCDEPEASRATVEVLTRDRVSCTISARQGPYVLSIHVNTAPIERVMIDLTSKRLALGHKHKVAVLAFDSEDCHFSSLSGLKFLWSTRSVNSLKREESPLVLRKISDSILIPHPGLMQEKMGNFGYEIEITGTHTGRALLKAQLNSSLTNDTVPIFHEVIVDVVEDLWLCPHDPIVLNGVDLALEAWRKLSSTEFERVKDLERYEWSSEDDSVSVDVTTGVVSTTGQTGKSLVTFSEKGYKENAKNATVRVVELEGLQLSFTPFDSKALETTEPEPYCQWSPGSTFPQDIRLPKRHKWQHAKDGDWVFRLGSEYFVMATLTSSLLQERETVFVTRAMHFSFQYRLSAQDAVVGEGNQGKVELVTEKMEPFLSNVAVFRATHVGFVDLHVSFSHGGLQREFPKQRIRIVSPVKVLDQVIRLPLDPESHIFHSYTLRAEGGTGNFRYEDDSGAGWIDESSGLVSPKRGFPENFKVFAIDSMDSENRDSASVELSIPVKVQIRFELAHAVVGQRIQLAAVLYNNHGETYHNCSGFFKRFTWSSSSPLLNKVGKRKLGLDDGSCSIQSFEAVQAGDARVEVRFGSLVGFLSIKILPAVQIVFPEPNLALDKRNLPVALIRTQTTTSLVLSGGNAKDEFKVDLVANESGESVKRREASQDELRVSKLVRVVSGRREYNVFCGRLGTFEITVRPEATAVIICAEVKEAKVVLELSAEQNNMESLKRCTKTEHNLFVNDQSLHFSLQLFDTRKRQFTDIGSSNVEWEIQPQTARTALSSQQGQTPQHRMVSLPASYEGTFTLKASLKSEAGAVLFSADREGFVSKQIAFQPANLRSIIADPLVQTCVNINHGADDLVDQLECNLAKVGVSLLSLQGRNATIRFASGESDSPTDISDSISCVMKCLVGSLPIETSFSFARVTSMALNLPYKIREGTNFTGSVQLFDAQKHPFSAEMQRFVNISFLFHPHDSITLEQPLESQCENNKRMSESLCDGIQKGIFMARKAGATSVHADASIGKVHAEHTIQIYAGISITAGRMKTVEPNVEFRLVRKNGPFADATFCPFEVVEGQEFVTIKDDLAGLFEAKSVGEAKVRAVCREHDEVIDFAEIVIRVKYLQSMEIVPSLLHMVEGDMVKVRAHFPEASDFPPDYDMIHRSFRWSVDNETVVTVLGVHPDEDELGTFSVWVKGKASGQATVKVEAKTSSSGRSGLLIASAPVVVEHQLKILSPGQLLLPRTGSIPIATSADVFPDSSTRLFFHTCISEAGCRLSTSILTVSPSGVVQAGDILGSSEVIVEFRSVLKGSELVQQRSVHVVVAQVGFVGVESQSGKFTFPAQVGVPVKVGLYDSHGRMFTAPFNTLRVTANVSNPDCASIKLDESGKGWPASQTLVVKGEKSCTTTLAVSITSPLDSDARTDFVPLRFVPLEQAFRIVTNGLVNKDNKVLIVPDREIVIPMHALDLTLVNAGELTCAAQLDDKVLESAVEEQDTKHVVCRIRIPSQLSDPKLFVVSLKLSSKVLQRESFSVKVGFALTSDDIDLSTVALRPGCLEWPYGRRQVVVRVSDEKAAIEAVSSDRSVIKLRKMIAPSGQAEFALERSGNQSCGEVTVTFEERETGQKEEVRFNLECEHDGLFRILRAPDYQLVIALVVLLLFPAFWCSWSRQADIPSLGRGDPYTGVPEPQRERGL